MSDFSHDQDGTDPTIRAKAQALRPATPAPVAPPIPERFRADTDEQGRWN